MGVLAQPFCIQHDASMLNVAFRIVQQRTDGTNAVVEFEGGRHLLQPMWREAIDVIVEKQQQPATGGPHSGIVHGRKIEGTAVRKRPQPIRSRLAAEEVEQFGLV